MLRAKAVLCPGLKVSLYDEKSGERESWLYEDGLRDYLLDALQGAELVPADAFVGEMAGNREAASWAVAWLPEGGDRITSYNVCYTKLLRGHCCRWADR